MKKLSQNSTPYLSALKKYVSGDVLPLDVPGHHMGNVKNKLKDFLFSFLLHFMEFGYLCDKELKLINL